MRIYIASRYSRHPEMQEHARVLEDAGHQITSRWIYGNETGAEEERAVVAAEDLEDLTKADMVMSFTEPLPENMTAEERKLAKRTPSKGGRHVEFGLGLALNKLLVIIGPRENVFHWLPTADVYPDLQSWLDTMEEET